MPERGTQRMIGGLVPAVMEEPATGGFGEVRVVERATGRVALGARGDRIDDAHRRAIRGIVWVGGFGSCQVVFRISAYAHPRVLVLSVDHFVQGIRKSRRTDPIEDHMSDGSHCRRTVASRFLPHAQSGVV